MEMLLILTSAQADALRGDTTPGHALDPVQLADGVRWVLPPAVLDDPAHAPAHAQLAALPIAEVGPEEFTSAEE